MQARRHKQSRLFVDLFCDGSSGQAAVFSYLLPKQLVLFFFPKTGILSRRTQYSCVASAVNSCAVQVDKENV